MTDLETTAVAVAGVDDVEDPTGAIPSRAPRRVEAKPFAGSARATDVNAALQAYGQAVMRLVQREELIARAHEEIATAREQVAAAAAKLTELGIPIQGKASRTRARSSGGGPVKAPGTGPLSDTARKVLEDLRGAGAATSSVIADRTGLTPQQIGVTCTALERRGLITREVVAGAAVWHASPPDEQEASDG